MARAPLRSVKERTILYSLEVAGVPLATLNRVFRVLGYREVPKTTYNANMRNEALLFKAHPELLAFQAKNPLPYGRWPTWWKDAVKYMREQA